MEIHDVEGGIRTGLLGTKIQMTLLQKILTGVFLFLGIAITVTACFVPMIVDHVVENEIYSQTTLRSGTENTWAKLPGKSGVNLYRNVTVYEPQNIMDILFLGQAPKVKETKTVYSAIQQQQIVNTVYVDDSVSGNKFVTFKDSFDSGSKYSVVNPGVFAAWYLAKTLTDPKTAWLTVGLVIENLVEQLPLNLYESTIAAAIAGQIPGFTIDLQGIFVPPLQAAQLGAILADPYYGFNNQYTIRTWIYCIRASSAFDIACSTLKNHFFISQADMTTIYNNFRTQVVGPIENAIFPAKFGSCGPATQVPCNGQFFSAIQFAQSAISLGATPPEPTVALINKTLHDMIELNYYYNQVWATTYPGLTFQVPWMLGFLGRNYAYNFNLQNQIKDPSVLQNKGNIEYIYSIGEQFDKSGNLNVFDPMTARFKTTSNQHSFVIWSWLKQMVSNFARRENSFGNAELAAIGPLGSEAIYYSFRNLTEFLYPELISGQLIMDNPALTCQQIFSSFTENVNTICANHLYSPVTQQTYKQVLHLCNFDGTGPVMSDFMVQFGIPEAKQAEAVTFCTANPSLGARIQTADSNIAVHYACASATKCTPLELAVQQWTSSAITSNPLAVNFVHLTPVYSVSDWDPVTVPHAFEYGYFQNYFKTTQPGWLDPITAATIKSKYLLSFNSLFNSLQVQQAFILYRKGDLTTFTATFGFTKFESLINYIRFVIIQFRLNGATIQKSGKELFFGYSDTFGEDMRHRDPAAGGDLALNTWVKFGDANMIQTDANDFQVKYNTGSSTRKNTRLLQKYQGYTQAIYNQSYFDGSTVTTQWKNPWLLNEDITQSTDGIQFHPFVKSDEVLRMYIPQVYRSISLLPSTGKDIHGLSTIKYSFNPADLKASPAYGTKYDLTISLSEPYQAPVLASLPHFYGSPYYAGQVQFVDSQNSPIKPSANDHSYLYVEPYSGAPLETVIQLMISMQIEPDLLFANTPSTAIPLLTLYNQAAFTSSDVDDNLGYYLDQISSLKSGLRLKEWGWYIILAGGIVFILVGIAIILYARHKSQE